VRTTPALLHRPGLSLVAAGVLTVVALGASGAFRVSAVRAMNSDDQLRFTRAYRDRPALYRDGCHLEFLEATVRFCTYGDTSSTHTIVLLGDSHAAHWFPALERIADEQKWRLVSATKGACPSIDVELRLRRYRRAYHECHDWREDALKRVIEMRPALVVLANARRRYLSDISPSEWGAGTRRTLVALSEHGLRTLLLQDTPEAGFVVPTCLARAVWTSRRGDGSECAFPRQSEQDAIVYGLERVAARGLSGVSVVDLSELVCGGDDLCEPLRDGHVVYIDAEHLSASFAASLAKDLLPVVLAAASASRSPSFTPEIRHD
jgi:hypothetical protein